MFFSIFSSRQLSFTPDTLICYKIQLLRNSRLVTVVYFLNLRNCPTWIKKLRNFGKLQFSFHRSLKIVLTLNNHCIPPLCIWQLTCRLHSLSVHCTFKKFLFTKLLWFKFGKKNHCWILIMMKFKFIYFWVWILLKKKSYLKDSKFKTNEKIFCQQNGPKT